MNLKRTALVASLLVFVTAAAGVWWLSRNLDDIAQSAIQNYGGAMTLAKVKVGAVQLSPTTGKGSIRDLSITNPKGFKTPHALQVRKIDVEVDITTVTDQVIVIRKIVIEAPDVVYEKGEGLTNFDALMRNITLYIGESNPSGARKLIVDSLTIHNAKAQTSAPLLSGKTVSVALPDITLKNVGRAQGGVTPGELGGIVANALRKRLSDSISFNRLWQSGGQALDKAGAAVKGLFGK